MGERDDRYNSSPKGKARKSRYLKEHRKAILLHGRMRYRGKRLIKLRAALRGATEPERSRLKASIGKLMALIRDEGK